MCFLKHKSEEVNLHALLSIAPSVFRSFIVAFTFTAVNFFGVASSILLGDEPSVVANDATPA